MSRSPLAPLMPDAGASGHTADRMAARKADHIRICLDEDVESRSSAFSSVSFAPEALPDCALGDVDLSRSFLGRRFSLPLLVTGMTGGVERGQEINEALALAAAQHGIPMGLGSQRMMLRSPELRRLFDIRRVAPDLFVIGNLGAQALGSECGVEDVLRLVGELGLSAFALHLNALQECIQPEGDTDFKGVLVRIEELARALPVPLVVKEVGSGMTGTTFRRLVDCGVAAVDVGGRGGTSWSVIEGLRSDEQGNRLGRMFRDWGLSTEASLRACVAERNRQAGARHAEIIATGGIRDGLQVAKAVALGASMVGVGLPLFRAAAAPSDGLSPLESVSREIDFFQRGLAIATFCAGARKLEELQARLQGEPA